MALLTATQIINLGFKSIGDNVKISDKASFYGVCNITIGDNVRIDDFVVISAGTNGISIGSNIHVAVFSSLIGKGKITLQDFSNISSRVSIYSSTDDFSGEFLTSPVLPSAYTNIISGDVTICKHVVIGCGSVVLPNTFISEGCAVGALSMVKGICKPFTIYAGVPAKEINKRSQNLKHLEKLCINDLRINRK